MRRIVCCLIMIVLSTILMGFRSNQPFKAIVLINGDAYLVDLEEDGTIAAMYQKIENYFTTRESHGSILARLTRGERSSSGSIVFYEKEIEPEVSFSNENKLPIRSGNSQYIGFSPFRALLQTEAVNQIRRIAKEYGRGKISGIHIYSYHNDTYRARALARNRSQAIKDLLSAFGVPGHIIGQEITIVQSGGKTDFVRIEL